MGTQGVLKERAFPSAVATVVSGSMAHLPRGSRRLQSCLRSEDSLVGLHH